jgi:hypothetical protein
MQQSPIFEAKSRLSNQRNWFGVSSLNICEFNTVLLSKLRDTLQKDASKI